MIVGDVAFSVHSLLGANGGALALAYGAGAASGWAFAISTAYRSMKNQLTEQRASHKQQIDDLKETGSKQQAECDRRIAELERWVKEQGDRYVSGLERQLAQARSSAESMTGRIDHGRITPLDDQG